MRATTKDERAAVDTVLHEFFTLTDAGWIHKRCDEEIAKARVASETARNNGKKGGRPPKTGASANPEITQRVSNGLAEQNPAETERKAPKTNTNTNTSISSDEEIGHAPKAPATSVPKPAKPEVDVPDWLPSQAWEMWDRFRKAKGAKTWTADAKNLSIRTLTQMRADGQDPVKVIEQSIERGWTGLFQIKAVGALQPAQPTLNRQEALEARNREVAERFARSITG